MKSAMPVRVQRESNIGVPLTRYWRVVPSGSDWLSTMFRKGLRAAMRASSFCRSASFQPALAVGHAPSANTESCSPSISSTGPDTWVKRPSPSCSQCLSVASSVRAR